MSDTRLNYVYNNILADYGVRNETFSSLLDKWSCFIEECEDGYQWDYSEYLHEVRVRHYIQLLLNNDEISNNQDLEFLFAQLDILDSRFKSLLQSNTCLNIGNGWWDKGVQKSAGEDYCHYMLNAHGIYVTSID